MSSLPQPPMVATPQLLTQGATPGPFQGYMNPGQGTSIAPPNTASNLIQGIAAFMDQYKKGREEERMKYANLAQQNITNMMLGLPVDKKKTAQYMKKAGMDLDFESAVVPSTERQTGTLGAGAPTQAGGTTVPGSGAGVAYDVPGPPQLQQAPPPSWKQRLASGMGFGTPKIEATSPGMQALDRIAALGQQNLSQREVASQLASRQQGLQGQQMDVTSEQMNITMAALKGNPAAVEQATRMGVFKSLPGDELFRIGRAAGMTDEAIAKQAFYVQMGGPQMMQQLMKMSEGMADRFGGDLSKSSRYVQDIFTMGTSELRPSLTIDEKFKIVDKALDVQKNHPTVPLNLANAYATAAATPGGEKVAADLLSHISEKYPTAGNIDWKKWSSSMDWDMSKFRQQYALQAAEHELSVMNAVRNQLGKNADDAMKVLMDKDSSVDTRKTAADMLVSEFNKLGSLKVKLPGGQEISLGPGELKAERVYSWYEWYDRATGGGGMENIRIMPGASQEMIKKQLEGGIKKPTGMADKELKIFLENFQKHIQKTAGFSAGPD